MNCPSCGNEMEKGRLTAGGYQIQWVPEGEKTFLTVMTAHSVAVSRFSFSTKGIPACICQACRKVIADY